MLLLLHAPRSIDCTSYFELESAEYQKRGIQLSPELWLVKMMVRGRGWGREGGGQEVSWRRVRLHTHMVGIWRKLRWLLLS
jgi:hypothetical protein